MRYLADSVFSFTDLPIRLAFGAGLLGLAVSVVLGIAVLVAKFAGGIDVPGYAATMLVIVFFGALNMIGLGILGSYTWRAFENTKRRPGYVIGSQAHFPAKERARMNEVFVHPQGLCESANVGPRTRVWAFAHVLPGARIGADCNVCDHRRSLRT